MTSALDVLEGDFTTPLQSAGELADRVTTALDRQRQLLRDASAGWAVVPAVVGGQNVWLLVADDTESERRAREVITAFFGPADARILATTPTVEGASPRLGGVPNLRIIDVAGDPRAFVEALELMTSVRASAPTLRRELSDPIGYLLRDFYLALDQRDPQASHQLFARIEATGHVGSENLRFLRVERLARLGYWAELGELPWFSELARARRPGRITEHLIEAVWRTEFDEAAMAADRDAAASHFVAADVAARFGALLRAVDIPSTIAGRRLAALFAHLTGDSDRVERILGTAATDERGLLDVLTERVRPATPSAPVLTPLESARELFDEGDYSGVVAIAESHGDGPLIAMAVRASFELNDPRLAARAVALVARADPGALPDSAGFSRMLEAARRLADNLCGGWFEWFERVGGGERWPDAAEVARDLSTSWLPTELYTASAAGHAGEAVLRASDGASAREFRGCLDLLCSLARDLTAVPAADQFVDAVLLVLSADENPSSLVRGAFFDLLVEVIAGGPSRERYSDMVATAASLWRRVRSRDAIGWVLDICDALASSPCPDEAARSGFVVEVLNSVREFAGRMPADERALLVAIGGECGVAVVLPPPDEEIAESTSDAWQLLSGKLVGLYSLLDGVGGRLRTRLRELGGDVRVEQNSDTVASAALRSLAAGADYLIVDTRHAAHAATAAIDAARPRDRQLFPAGRGLSSFIARLREELEGSRSP